MNCRKLRALIKSQLPLTKKEERVLWQHIDNCSKCKNRYIPEMDERIFVIGGLSQMALQRKLQITKEARNKIKRKASRKSDFSPAPIKAC